MTEGKTPGSGEAKVAIDNDVNVHAHAQALRQGFASFNAAGFLASQKQENEHRGAPCNSNFFVPVAVMKMTTMTTRITLLFIFFAARELLAAAEALYPSSEEEEEEEGELGEAVKVISKADGTKGERKKRSSRGIDHSDSDSGNESTKRKHTDRKKKRKKKEKKEKKEKKSKTGNGSDTCDTNTDAPQAIGAANALFYTQKQGDANNLSFEKLYQGDVASYRRYDPSGYITSMATMYTRSANDTKEAKEAKKKKEDKTSRLGGGGGGSGSEVIRVYKIPDDDVMVHDIHLSKVPEYLPIVVGGGEGGEGAEDPVQALPDRVLIAPTANDYIMARTRAFNASTRLHPENLQLWLDFAAFQEEALEVRGKKGRGGRRLRGARKACAEKKIAILEKALKYHPQAPQLLIALLNEAATVCDDEEEMGRRWRWALLRQCPGNAWLWDRYIARKKTMYPSFKAREVMHAYSQAIRELHTHTTEAGRQGKAAVVSMIVSSLAFRMQTGYTESVVAIVRALIDINWFSPPGWPDDALESMYREYVNSTVDAVGDEKGDEDDTYKIWGEEMMKMMAIDGGQGEDDHQGGWVEVPAEALEKEQENVAVGAVAVDENPKKKKKETGWEALGPVIRAKFGHALKFSEAEQCHEEEDEDKDGNSDGDCDDQDDQDEEEMLLAKLGMDFDAAVAQEEENIRKETLQCWFEMERKKSASSWQYHDEYDRSTVWEDDIQPHLTILHDTDAKHRLLEGVMSLVGIGGGGSANGKTMWTLRFDRDCDTSIDTSSSNLNPHHWWQEHPDRHQFVINLLTSLIVRGPEHDNLGLAYSLFDLMSWTFESGDTMGTPKGIEIERRYDVFRERSKAVLEKAGDSDFTLWVAFSYVQASFATGTRHKHKEIKSALKTVQLCATNIVASRTTAQWDIHTHLPAMCEIALSWAGFELARGGPAPPSPSPHPHPHSVLDTVLLHASEEALVAAARPLVWVGCSLLQTHAVDVDIAVDASTLTAAKKGYQNALLAILARTNKVPENVENTCSVVQAAAMAEVLFSVVLSSTSADSSKGAKKEQRTQLITHGVSAALNIYKQVIASVDGTNKRTAVALQRAHCRLAVDAVLHGIVSSSCSPHSVRSLILSHLNLKEAQTIQTGNTEHIYTDRSLFLVLLRRLQEHGHATAQLRRLLHAYISSSTDDDDAVANAWMMLVEVEKGRSVHAQRTVFQRATASDRHRHHHHHPSVWRAYLRFEYAHGTQESVYRVFLRAIEAYPGSKDLWMDGMTLLVQSSSDNDDRALPRQLSELIHVMRYVFACFAFHFLFN